MRRYLFVLVVLALLAVACSGGAAPTLTPTAPVQNLTSGQAAADAQRAIAAQNATAGLLANCSSQYNPGLDTWSVQCAVTVNGAAAHLIFDVDDNTGKATLLSR